MRRRLVKLMAALIAAAAIALSEGETRAYSLLGYEGGFALGRWEEAVEFGYGFEDSTTQSPGSPDLSIVRNRYDEQLRVSNEGFYYIDPRLVTGIASVDLDFFQEQDRITGGNESLDGTLIGYDFSTTVLSEKPYTARFFTNRSQNVTSRSFAGRTENTNSTFGVNAMLREDSILRDLGIPFFTSRIEAHREQSDESTKQLGQTFKLDETRNIFNLEADKGFLTGDLGFRYEFVDEKQTGTSALAFQTNTLRLTYSKDFGPTLNRRWDSRINYSTRSGDNGVSLLWVDELLHIDHYESLASYYHYLLTQNDTTSGTVTLQNATVGVQYHAYKNLLTDLAATGSLQTLPEGRETMYAVQSSPSYTRRLPWNGSFFLTAYGRYQVDDNNLTSSQISIVDEPHTAPTVMSLNIGFTLDHSFVITTTIEIVDARGGARIPTTLNVDYEIIPQGNLTEIVPLPTSLVIQPGDPLLVSYTYQVAPSARFSTVSHAVNVGVRFPWVGVSFDHEDSKQTLLSGLDSSFLQDRTSDTATLDLDGHWGRLGARGIASYQILDSTNLSYKRSHLGQYLSYQAFWGISLSLNGDESWTDFTNPKRRSESRLFRFAADRYSPSGGFTSLFAGIRTNQDSEVPTEDFREVGIRARWVLGKLEAIPTFIWTDRSYGTTNTNDLRLEIRMIRRFQQGY